MALRIDPIDATSTALIVVDVQNHFVAALEISAASEMLATLQRAIAFCRERGIAVIYTRQAYRAGGWDRGLAEQFWNPSGEPDRLLDGSAAAEIHADVAPLQGDVVITKRRYSAFHGTDLDLVLRGMGVGTVIIAGVTTENCCHATARDAFFRDFEVGVLCDATTTFDYPDRGQGAMPAADVHRATLVILAASTADVMATDDLIDRTVGRRSFPARIPAPGG